MNNIANELIIGRGEGKKNIIQSSLRGTINTQVSLLPLVLGWLLWLAALYTLILWKSCDYGSTVVGPTVRLCLFFYSSLFPLRLSFLLDCGCASNEISTPLFLHQLLIKYWEVSTFKVNFQFRTSIAVFTQFILKNGREAKEKWNYT